MSALRNQRDEISGRQDRADHLFGRAAEPGAGLNVSALGCETAGQLFGDWHSSAYQFNQALVGVDVRPRAPGGDASFCSDSNSSTLTHPARALGGDTAFRSDSNSSTLTHPAREQVLVGAGNAGAVGIDMNAAQV